MALITCKECGSRISEFAKACPSCGAPATISKESARENQQAYQPQYNSSQQYEQVQQPEQVGYTQQQSSQIEPGEVPPKSWMVESILVALLCCLPFGIVGIISASNVESRWYAGDKVGAKSASEDAAKWTKIGFIGGIILYAILIVAAVLERSQSYDFYYY